MIFIPLAAGSSRGGSLASGPVDERLRRRGMKGRPGAARGIVRWGMRDGQRVDERRAGPPEGSGGLTAAALRPCFRARSFFLSRMHCTRWPIASPLLAIGRRRLLPRSLRSLPPSSACVTAGSVTAAASLLLTPQATSKLAHRSVVCVDDLGFAFAGRQRLASTNLGHSVSGLWGERRVIWSLCGSARWIGSLRSVKPTFIPLSWLSLGLRVCSSGCSASTAWVRLFLKVSPCAVSV